jgi:methyl-accepting chemotaxis protein
MVFSLSKGLNIKQRLILLVLTGILAMLLITGLNRLMDHYNTRSILLERGSQVIAARFQDIVNLENVYILTMSPAVLTEHQAIMDTLDVAITDILASTDGETAGLAQSIMSSKTEHQRIFQDVVTNTTQLEASKNRLIDTINAINSTLESVISTIDEEEVMLMMDGEFLTAAKVGARKETVDFKAFGNERMLNLVQNLLLYGDEKTYAENKKTLDTKIALAKKNMANIYKAAGSESILTAWEEIDGMMETLNQTQGLIFNQWSTNQSLRRNLTNTANTIQAVTRDITRLANEAMVKSSRWSSMVSLLVTILGLMILFVLGLVTYRAVAHPIAEAVSMIRDIAEGEGDLTKRLSITSNDEIGDMARWFNVFIEKLQTIITDVSQKSMTLDSSSETLSGLSGRMSDEIGNISRNAATVSDSAGDMSESMNGLAAVSEEYASNITMLAAAAEEMSATIQEIAGNTEKAHGVSSDAVTKAETALSNIRTLGNAATEINKVTEVITDISDQTNLLALNATIEAARAGEAGKGFAVVANEIKELARQTADATRGIKVIVEDIQNATAGTVGDIEHITGIVGSINDIVTTIASSVEEQTATTREIANNVAQASSGITDVNTGVSRSTTAARDIASDITEIHRSAEALSTNSVDVNNRSAELARLSADLKGLVGRFIV